VGLAFVCNIIIGTNGDQRPEGSLGGISGGKEGTRIHQRCEPYIQKSYEKKEGPRNVMEWGSISRGPIMALPGSGGAGSCRPHVNHRAKVVIKRSMIPTLLVG